MSVTYKSIHWNQQKKGYDLILLLLILSYLLSFIISSFIFYPTLDPVNLIIRSTGSMAIILLHLVLVIGPLCRINRKFLPLLYNRRHLGVTTFLIAAFHGLISLVQFHGGGNKAILVSLFTTNTHYDSLSRFPFHVLGFFALVILFLMAATSHDFWLKNLGQNFWKRMHMLVYIAYGLLIMHMMLGVVQLESSLVIISLIGTGMLLIITVHLWAGFKEVKLDRRVRLLEKEGMIVVGDVSEIKNNQAKIISDGKKRIAVFRYDNKISAVSNCCRHQGGPLGEGQVIGKHITCPWHGYQYFPENGTSPPPFTERIPTYKIKLVDTRILVDPVPYAPGTHIAPVKIP